MSVWRNWGLKCHSWNAPGVGSNLFSLVMEEITVNIQKGKVPCCIIFVNYIMLVGDSPVEVNDRLEEWRKALESRELRIIRSKIGYI